MALSTIGLLVTIGGMREGGTAEPAVEAGYFVSYALTRDGRLYAWGANFHGQLANGTFTTNNPYGTSEPLLVALPGGATAWSAVQVGLSHTLALANSGNLYSWGRNDVGELGTGPEMVTASNVEVPKPAGVTRWITIDAGEEHSVALGDNEQLYAWGDNFYGQLGNGDYIRRPAPTPVLLPGGVTHWTEVWAGGHATFARGNDGTVYGWGRNSGGELGIGTVSGSPSGVSSPTAVLLPAGVTGWRTISVGRYHTVALDQQGQLYGWGSNEFGGLGYGHTEIQSTPIALAAPAGVASWRTLSASHTHNLAISADGRLFAWGRGAANATPTPRLLIGSRTNWNAIAGGADHALAVASDCGLYAWGWNYYGALGSDRPSGHSLSTPELVGGLTDLCDTPPGTRELHVVGVHAGAGSTSTYDIGDGFVWVNRPQKRVVLFLSSYSPVHWRVDVGFGTILERVILGGYYRQTVEGVGPETEVIPAWSTSGAQPYMFIGTSLESQEFYAAKPRLCAMTGLDIFSFHGTNVAPYQMPIVIDRVQDDERLRCDYPQPTPASELPQLNFRIAFHNQSPTSGVVFQDYTLAGPVNGERVLPAMRVVPDAGGRYYYGTENHQVWRIDSQTSSAQQMNLPATVPELSWPMGLAFDSQRNRVLLVSLGGQGYLYAYSPSNNQWSVVRNMQDKDLDGLEYHAPTDVLYSLAVDGSGGRPLMYRLNSQGAIIGEISLPFIPIRFGPGGYRSELVSVGEYLVLLLEPTHISPSDISVQESRIYLIDPRTGESWLTYRRAYLPENKRPTVEVVWPGEGMVFPAGTTIPLRADASDADGLVDVVEFFANGVALGRGRRSPDSSATFQLDWPNPLPGSYTVTARATDARGLSAVSSPVHTTIREGEPPPPVRERELHAVGISSGVNADGTPPNTQGQGHASVAVNRPGKSVTLFLSSSGPVLWHVSSSNGTTIEKVILGGYYAQAITGVSSNVPIERVYYDGGTADYLNIGWTMESRDFYLTVQRLCQRTGLDLSSFHGEASAPHPVPFVIDSVQNDARLRCDYPRPVDPSHLPNLNFRLAWNNRSGTVVFKDYTLAGPQSGSRLFQRYRVVTDAGGRFYYGAEQHEIWRVDSQTGTVQEMMLPAHLPELSWPMGAAFDSQRNRVIVVTFGGEGFLYAYSPAQNQWSLVGDMANRDVDCLVYHGADDSLYAVTQAYEGVPSLLRLNAAGEIQSEIRLPVQPFRVGLSGAQSEIASVGDYLVLLLENDSTFPDPGVQPESRMYLIDPHTGQVSLTYRRILFPDQDDDGVPDDRDQCPHTAPGAVVDSNGCSAIQRDADGDGVPNNRDQCPDTLAGAIVDVNGCSAAQRDSDSDGVTDDRDQCPDTLPGTIIGANGCPSRTNQVCAPPIQWQAGLGDEHYQRFHRVQNHPDGGYIVGGQSFSRGQMWVVRLLADGSNAWERFYEGHLNDMQSTSDGGFIIAGAAPYTGNAIQAALLRIDANGDVLWSRTYGGDGQEIFESARETSDGGFIAAGSSWSAPGAEKTSPHFGQSDAWIVKVDAQGNKIWERSYGGTGLDGAGTTLQTADGGYLVSAGSDSPANGNKSLAGFGGVDSWVLKLDSNGDKAWERVFGTTNHDALSLIDVFPSGAFLLGGFASSPANGNKTSPSFGGSDGWVLMVGADGERIWDRTFGGTDSDGLFTGRRVPAGGFILSGWSQSPPGGNKTSRKVGGQDMWLVRIDSAGNLLWERSIGGGNPYGSSANDVEPTADGGFITAGETFNDIGGDKTAPWLGSGDGWVVKLGSESDSCDDDNDGVPNDRDQCPNTSAGTVVNAQGCNIAQLCPCDGPWRNHGEYVQCVMDHAWEFYRLGLIDADERKAITRAATGSDCGKRNPPREPVCIHFCPQTRDEREREGVRVVLSGDAGGGNVIESSTDLIHWAPVEGTEGTIVGDEILFSINPNVPAKFYRVRLQSEL